jgi:hypothetical protein
MLTSQPALLRKGCAAVLLIISCAQLLVVGKFVNRLQPLRVLLQPSEEDRVYLRRLRRHRHAAVEWLDARLPGSSLTLVLGLHELYWFDHPVRGGGNFDGPRIAHYLDAGTPQALLEKLKRDNFTHVAVYSPGIGSAPPGQRGPGAERITILRPRTARLLQRTLGAHGRVVAQMKRVALFELTVGGNTIPGPRGD